MLIAAILACLMCLMALILLSKCVKNVVARQSGSLVLGFICAIAISLADGGGPEILDVFILLPLVFLVISNTLYHR